MTIKNMSRRMFEEQEINHFITNCNILIEGLTDRNKKELFVFLRKMESLKKVIIKIDRKLGKDRNGEFKIKLFKELNCFFKHAARFEKSINNELFVAKIKKLFRRVMKEYFLTSILVKRGYEKPRGYPGDSGIIESIYDYVPYSKGIGSLLDEYLLNDRYSVAIRARKNEMKKFLKDFIESSKKKNLNILNLACGSCREIRELFSGEFGTKKTVNFFLIDKDIETIRYAKSKLVGINKNLRFYFYADDVLAFFMNKKKTGVSLPKFDLIYSIGLADYLPNSILGPMVKHGLGHLSKLGRLIIAHKNLKVCSTTPSDWSVDWTFIPRDKKDLVSLINKYCYSPKYSYQCSKIEKGAVFFLKLSLNQK